MLQPQNFISEENVLRLEKGKRGLLNILFGRTTIIVLALLLQFFFFFIMSQWLQQYVPYALGASVIIGFCVVFYLLNQSGEPTIKMTWVILVLAMPVFGTMLFLWVHADVGHRVSHRLLDQVICLTNHYLKQDEMLNQTLRREKPELAALGKYMEKYGNYPIYPAGPVTYFPSGEAQFEDLLVELEHAKKFIFLEYFIIDEGYMWGRVLEILRRKVEEGVEVRVLYDGTCAIFRLPYNYPKKLQALGIKCKVFAPIRPFVSTHYNNRDHRKILIIDGHTAYTGGINLADEYINRKKLYGHWKDVAIKIKGDAVKSFTLMFLQMWNVREKTENIGKTYLQYLLGGAHLHVRNGGYVLPYGDSPLDGERVGEMVYMDILNNAHKYVHIMTPYLILDNEMVTALTFAAKRGVEVVIVMPHIPDKKYAFALAKTHYKQLINEGVKIYEYVPGFVHAKVFTSDDTKAVVGTINMDYRSLYHHFECGVYLEDVPEIAQIEQDIQDTMTHCVKITMAEMKHEPLTRRLMGMVLKLIAPLM